MFLLPTLARLSAAEQNPEGPADGPEPSAERSLPPADLLRRLLPVGAWSASLSADGRESLMGMTGKRRRPGYPEPLADARSGAKGPRRRTRPVLLLKKHHRRPGASCTPGGLEFSTRPAMLSGTVVGRQPRQHVDGGHVDRLDVQRDVARTAVWSVLNE